jgi:hypothetical protein
MGLRGEVAGGGEGQLNDQLLSRIAEAVCPHRADGHGWAWALLSAHHDELKGLLDDGLTVPRLRRVQAAEKPEARAHGRPSGFCR